MKCLEAELAAARALPRSSEGSTRLQVALRSYDSARLRYSDKKTFEDSLRPPPGASAAAGVLDSFVRTQRVTGHSS